MSLWGLPSWVSPLRAGTLPCDIPHSYEPIRALSALCASLLKQSSLMDHQHVYPFKQLTALIYKALVHGIARTDTGADPDDSGSV